MFKETLKKIDIIKVLKSKTGYSFRFCEKIINDLLEIFIEEILSGNLNLKNVGSFNLIYKKKRIGRNPKTMEKYSIPQEKQLSLSPQKNYQ